MRHEMLLDTHVKTAVEGARSHAKSRGKYEHQVEGIQGSCAQQDMRCYGGVWSLDGIKEDIGHGGHE